MPKSFEKKMQEAKEMLHHVRQKVIVRVWNVAKRMEPRATRRNKNRKG